MRIDLIRSASFRLPLIFAGVFCLSISILGGLLYFQVQHSLEREMKDRIASEVDQLLVDYRQDGLGELEHDVRERTEASDGSRLLYFIRNPQNKIIFDVFTPSTLEPGWHVIGERLIVLIVELKDGYALGVGGELTEVVAMKQALLRALAVMFACALFISIVSGVVVSRRFLESIDQVRVTADAIAQGDLSRRIPLRGSHDNFDELAKTINGLLDRIDTLVQEVRNVATGIAHDLRTPMAKLRNHLETLLDEGGDRSERLEEAIRLLDDSFKTFNGLLRIAELDSGQHRRTFENVDLSLLFLELKETYDVMVEEAGGHLETSIEPAIAISGDKSLLFQLFANLIENSLIHGGDGVRIAAKLYRSDSGPVVAALHDSGQGVPKEFIDKITTPFFKVDSSIPRKGSGLGLALVAAIARLHGAALTFSNDHGFSVTVTFVDSV